MQLLVTHEDKDVSCCAKDHKTGEWRIVRCRVVDRKDAFQNICMGVYLLWSCVNKTGKLEDCEGVYECLKKQRYRDCVREYVWPRVW